VGLNILSGIPNVQNGFAGGGGSTGRNPLKFMVLAQVVRFREYL
jgi:hypothetical protein